jgi:Acetyltransferase (GNAT) domain
MASYTGGTETQRLLLIPWSDDHLDEFAALCADAEAMRFISGGTPLPQDAVEEIHRRTRSMWDEYGFGPWAATEKSSGRWIGRIGLNLLADWPGPDKWEVGYELVRAFWGRMRLRHGGRPPHRSFWLGTDSAQPDHQRDRAGPSCLAACDGEVLVLPARRRSPGEGQPWSGTRSIAQP